MAVTGPESWGATQMRDLTADQPMHMRVIARLMMPFQENARIWQQKAHHIFQAHWRLALLIQKPSLPADPVADNGILSPQQGRYRHNRLFRVSLGSL